MEEESKNKYDLLMHLLSEGDAMVCLDARQDGVDVPKSHQGNPALSLVFNLDFKRPIEVTHEGIFATLSFSGRPHKCVLPFEAVWAIYEPTTQKGNVWEECLPLDMDLPAPLASTTPAKTRPDHLKAQKGGNGKLPSSDGDKPKRDRSHLRVIK